jgi:hypothetical protein
MSCRSVALKVSPEAGDGLVDGVEGVVANLGLAGSGAVGVVLDRGRTSRAAAEATSREPMIGMTPAEFATKWSQSQRNERAAAQEHLIDLCRMLHARIAAACVGWAQGRTALDRRETPA